MANQRHPSPWAVALAGTLSLAAAMGIGRFAFTPLLPLMIRDGQLDLAGGGWLAAANYAGYLVGAMTASRLRWSAVRLAAVALLLTVVLTAGMALPLPVAAWSLLRFAAGVCSAWTFVGTAVWCLGELAARGRAGWGGAVYSGVGFGIAAAGLLAWGAAAGGASAPQTWCALAVSAALLLVQVFAVLRRLGGRVPVARSNAPATTRRPTGTGALVFCYGVLGFGYILPATFLPVLARAIVEDPRVFGLAWPVFGLTAAASTFLAGWALRHASRLQVWAASHVAMGVGVLLPSLWPSAAAIAGSAILVGGTFMIVTMLGIQEIRARCGSADPTPMVSRMTAAFALGQIAGPVASSALLHMPGFAENGLHLALQLASISLFATAAWLWHLTRQTHQEILHAP